MFEYFRAKLKSKYARISTKSNTLPSLEKFEIIGESISRVAEIIVRETTNPLWIRGETSARSLRGNYVANYTARI